MIKYCIIALLYISVSTGSFTGLRGYLRKLPFPEAAAAAADRQISDKRTTVPPTTVPPKNWFSELTHDEVVDIFIRNAH
jgi:hypothetical protein